MMRELIGTRRGMMERDRRQGAIAEIAARFHHPRKGKSQLLGVCLNRPLWSSGGAAGIKQREPVISLGAKRRPGRIYLEQYREDYWFQERVKAEQQIEDILGR